MPGQRRRQTRSSKEYHPVLRPKRRVSFSGSYASGTGGRGDSMAQHTHNTRSRTRSTRPKLGVRNSQNNNNNNNNNSNTDDDVPAVSRRVSTWRLRTPVDCNVHAPRSIYMATNNINPFDIFKATRGSNMLLLSAAKVTHRNNHLLLHTGGDDLTQLFANRFVSEASELERFAGLPQPTSLFGTQLQQLLPTEFGYGDELDYKFLAVFDDAVSVCTLSVDSAAGTPLVQTPVYAYQRAPIVSATQFAHSQNLLSIAENDFRVCFVDIPSTTIIKRFDLASLYCCQASRTRWAQLHAKGVNSFYYACGRGLINLDPRCKQINECAVCPVDANERITCLGGSSNANLFYVGSDVHLHCVDVRCTGKRLSQCSIAHWVHDMHNPVKYMSSCLRNQVEYVALISSLPFDLRVCQMQTVNHRRPRHSGNARKPVVAQCFEDYLMKNRVGERDPRIEQRASACVTGLALRPLLRASDKSEAEILTSNLLGEVTSYRLGGEYSDDDAMHVVENYYDAVEYNVYKAKEVLADEDVELVRKIAYQ